MGGGGGDDLVLGLAVPLTDGAGQPDVYGVRSRMGAELAVEELNAANAVRRAASSSLRIVDDKGDPEPPPSPWRTRWCRTPRVLAVVGHVYSGATIAAAQQYTGRLPAVATSATSPEISQLGDWIFRVASSDSANAVALARVGQRAWGGASPSCTPTTTTARAWPATSPRRCARRGAAWRPWTRSWTTRRTFAPTCCG